MLSTRQTTSVLTMMKSFEKRPYFSKLKMKGMIFTKLAMIRMVRCGAKYEIVNSQKIDVPLPLKTNPLVAF